MSAALHTASAPCYQLNSSPVPLTLLLSLPLPSTSASPCCFLTVSLTPHLSSHLLPHPIPSSELEGKVSRLSYESPRIVLLKMLDGTAATLRTNFFNEDRYALSLRVSLSHSDTDTDTNGGSDSDIDSYADSAVNRILLFSTPASTLALLNARYSHQLPLLYYSSISTIPPSNPVPPGAPCDHDERPPHCIETHAIRGLLLPRQTLQRLSLQVQRHCER